MTSAASMFDAHAAHYDVARRRLIPCFEALYATAVEAITLAGPDPRRVLDLGGGTGMLSAFVIDTYPDSKVTLFDGAPLMLEKAREILGYAADLIEGDLYDDLPGGPWDAVISALAIHHLTDEGKRHVFAAAFGNLQPGGVFVNADHILGPTPSLDLEYRRWHEMKARQSGIDDREWSEAEERMTVDHLSPLMVQLQWLAEAGFVDVDVLFKDHGFAVMVARKPD